MVRPNRRSTRVVGVDWSGRRQGERPYLWLAEVIDGRPGRLWNATRTEAADAMIAMARETPRLIVGLDFAFSLPAWFLRRHGIANVAALWSDVDRLEQWMASCRPPFWGRPGRRLPIGAEQQRWTEKAA